MLDKFFHNKVLAFRNLAVNMYNQDYLLTWEKSLNEINATILLADIFKELHKNGISLKTFETGLGISIFRDKSTRTRFSFVFACDALGLDVVSLDEEKSQVSHGETVRETAVMISFLSEVIGIRDDMYIGAGDSYMREVGQAVQKSYDKGVLAQRPSVINLQSDIDHPTQSLSDLSKLVDYFGSSENLKGKKLAMTWAYSPSYGKPLSVPQGIIALMTRFGMDVTLAYPEGYELMPEVVRQAEIFSKESTGSFRITHSLENACKEADVVYPKSWAPFEIMKQRTELLKKKDVKALDKLEQECLQQNSRFMNWECNKNLMELTRNGNALYMHCLPADISGVSCKQGEVTEKVFEKYKKDLYHQASYKPFVIAAMIFLTRMKDPLVTLEKLIRKNTSRILS
ncbi:MAG TPA: knotted carbamoyltransferase YgeW [Candidatus Cloacimonetes bacterium]|nr:knotted carbamoyltransferase YgeW [Candidatus Cloacimonadota bacterium]HEX37589.1 knotted carbamoyltransferase YgeW [Candidatus Cloacimonadota bacterium]